MVTRWGALVIAGSLVAVGAAAGPAAADGARAKEILVKSLEPTDTTYSAVQVSQTVGMAARNRRPRPQRVLRNGNRLRMELANRQVVYDDGTRSLLYLPTQNVVEESPSRFNAARLRSQKRLLSGPRVVAELLPEDTVAGRTAHVVAVRDTQGKAPQRKVWVDKETYLQLRQDVTNRNGRTVSTYFTSINYGANPTPAAMAFNPPADARRVRAGLGRPVPAARAVAAAGKWGGLLKPGYVPAGYRFRNHFFHEFRGQQVLVSVYAKPGSGTLSMFQGPVMGMAGMAGQERRKLRVLTGKKGTADITLLAPLPEDELQKVMDSVTAAP